MEVVEPDAMGGKVFKCYTAPGETFSSEEDMKEHYRTELHRFNLKRKVAGLAPLSRALFEVRGRPGPSPPSDGLAAYVCVAEPVPLLAVCAQEREARTEREAAANPAPPAKLTTAERREHRDQRREQRVAAKSKNPNSKAAHFVATQELSEDQYWEHKLKSAPEFDLGSDLFSRHRSANLSENLAYMAKEHGFYLPYFDFCADVEGLVHYLQQKVYVGNVALSTDRQFHSTEAVQAHMKSKTECRVSLEGNEDELGEYYNMEALAAGSPLWEVEPVTDSEDEEDEEEMGEAESSGAAGEEVPTAFDALFERAVALGVLNEADVDGMTDAVAQGLMSEAEAAAEWLPAVRRAQRKARRQGGAAASSAPGLRFRVVYSPLQLHVGDDRAGVESLPTLALVGREVGHRSMSRYFKQKYRPSSNQYGGLGSLGVHRPELALLLEQYADAGVLSTHLQMKFQVKAKSEINRGDQHKQQRLYVKQGITNNTTMNGMKHYKNQSLCY